MPAIPPQPTQFAGEIVRSDGERSKVYVDGRMLRVERHLPAGQVSIIISRPDKRVIWALTPESKTYSQTKLPDNFERIIDPLTLCDWTEDGAEVIDGRRCRRFVGRYVEALGPAGSAHEICFVDAETGVRRRMITYDKNGKLALTVDCLNAVVGPPPRTVFEMPADYKRGYHRRARC
jgi:hypothetical protein